MHTISRTNILLFTKIPGFAPCKTRLHKSSQLNENEIQTFSTAMLLDVFEQCVLATSSNLLNSLHLCSDPEISDITLQTFAANFEHTLTIPTELPLRYFPQGKLSFAKRINHCLYKSYEVNNAGVLILGSDAPLVPFELLIEASKIISSGEAVIGPTSGGGIYLLGIPEISLKNNLDFSTPFDDSNECELSALSKLFFKENIPARILPFHIDIDRSEDLATLLTYFEATSFETYNSKANTNEIPLYAPCHFLREVCKDFIVTKNKSDSRELQVTTKT